MLTRPFGQTGHHSSLAVFGGIALHFLDEEEGGRILAEAIARGVNHIDVAPGYGTAEEKLGPHLAPVRDQVLLSEKSAERSRDGVWRDLDQTLTRLRTDSVDLYQLHGVTDLDDLEARAGAVQALLEMRDQGVCRFIGTTGHNLGTAAAQHEALQRHDLDSVMLPVYPRLWADQGYRVAAEALLEEAVRRGIGVLAIKAAAARPWGRGTRFADTWYEPQRDREGLERGVRFALSVPGVTAFCTPGDARLLPWALDAAESFRPLTEVERSTAVRDAGEEALIFPLPT